MTTIKNNTGKIDWTYSSKRMNGFANNFHVMKAGESPVAVFADVEYNADKKAWKVGIFTNAELAETYFPCSDVPTVSDLFEVCHNVEVWTIPLVIAGFGYNAFCDETGHKIYE